MLRKLTAHFRGNAVGYLALFVALGGTSYAVSSKQGFLAPNGRIYACAAGRTGAVRLVKKGAKCNRREQLVSWSQVGPAGQPGANGTPGASGAPGANGASGATNVVVRTQSAQVAAGAFYVFGAECAAGERAVGGGAGFTENGGKEVLEQSYPAHVEGPSIGFLKAGETPNGWASIIRNNNATPFTGIGYAVCAKP